MSAKCPHCKRPLTLGHWCPYYQRSYTFEKYLRGIHPGKVPHAPENFERWVEFLGPDPIHHIGHAFQYNVWDGLGTLAGDTIIILTGAVFIGWLTGLLPPMLYTPGVSKGLSRVGVTGGWRVALAVSFCCFVGIMAWVIYGTGLYTVLV
jgi:hypothetical protein